MMDFSRMTEPLEYIPVRHACGDFEVRLMRWYGGQADRDQGFVDAGSPCTQCAPQGRSINPNYPTLDAVTAAAAKQNAAKLTA
jgi:hypothetical protein